MSYTSLRYHIIFSTKNRLPLLSGELRERLVGYLIGIMKNLKAQSYVINGPEDHLHVLVSLHPDISLSEFMRQLKAGSSKWIHETFSGQKDFAWQRGYSAFSVSQSVMKEVCRYIEKQQEHHKRVSFIDELKLFLDAHQIEYDPKYLG